MSIDWRKIVVTGAILVFCSPNQGQAQAVGQRVLPGIDVLMAESHLISNQRVGLITNPTGISLNGQSTIDVLFNHPHINLVALFGPEHGVRGDAPAGAYVPSYEDARTNLPVYSLYGQTRTPTADMLERVDVLLFDMQDVGIRPYTYISTMAYAMQAAATYDIPFIVLDRPNPLGGELVEGPILEEQFSSFIGLYPIPYVHGMTIGELALYFNSEFNIGADLTVIPMQGWRRSLTFVQTGLLWVPTSPHVPHATTPFFLATTGAIGELQTLNEGVGYTFPFETIAAEWIDSYLLAQRLNDLQLAGVFFREISYTPYYGAKKGIRLHGVYIHIADYAIFRPVHTQIAILNTIYSLYPNKGVFNIDRLNMFYKALGTDDIHSAIINSRSLEELETIANNGIEGFLKKRSTYLLYN